MGTSAPSPKPEEGGSILFWKLNAEVRAGVRVRLRVRLNAEVRRPSPCGAPPCRHCTCTAEKRQLSPYGAPICLHPASLPWCARRPATESRKWLPLLHLPALYLHRPCSPLPSAQAFLGASGVGSVVVKPCGLSGEPLP